MIRAALVACLAGLPAVAQEVQDCDIPQANARNVAEPWATASRSYAEGAIRLIALDNGEPGCCGWHLMVQYPAGGGDPWQECRVVSWRPQGIGFGYIDLAGAKASYDPARGLSVRVPVDFFDQGGAEAGFVGGDVLLLLNQAAGSLEAWLEGAPD